jgi:RNA polymerase sigma factor (sigma-70 family)
MYEVQLSSKHWNLVSDPESDPDGMGLGTTAPVSADGRSDLEIARLHRRLDGLEPTQRRVLRWRYGFEGEELSHREIASRLGVSCSTAHAIEQRGLDALRRKYAVTTTPNPGAGRLRAA